MSTYSIKIKFDVDRDGLRDVEREISELNSQVVINFTDNGTLNELRRLLRDIREESERIRVNPNRGRFDRQEQRRRERLEREREERFRQERREREDRLREEREAERRRREEDRRRRDEDRRRGDEDRRRSQGGGGGLLLAGAMRSGPTAAVAAGGLLLSDSLRIVAELEQTMLRAKQAMGGTVEQMEALTEKAKEIGSTTALSTTDAARAIEILAKNGVKYEDILNGVADATVNMSLAMSSDMGETADFITDVLAQFNLKAEDSERVINQLVGASNASKLSFDDLKQAFANVGGVAGKIGVELEDLTALIASSSSSFAKGGDLGTGLKTFLQRMQQNTKPWREAMIELGLMNEEQENLYFTANGEMKSMVEIVGMLANSFEDLNEQEKANFATILGGADAVRAVLEIADLTTKEFEAMQKQIAATDVELMKDERAKTFYGQLKQMQSAMEAFKISLISPELLKFFTTTIEWTTDLIRAFGDLKNAISELPLFGGEAEEGSITDKMKKTFDNSVLGKAMDLRKGAMEVIGDIPEGISGLADRISGNNTPSVEDKKVAENAPQGDKTENNVEINQNFYGPPRPDDVKKATEDGVYNTLTGSLSGF